MSAGAFTLSKYQADDGTIYPVRVQPETITLNVGAANSAPSGAVDGPVYAKVSKSKRAYGVGCRKVSFRFTATPPTGYLAGQTYSLPVLTPTVYSGATSGTTGTYLSTAIVVVGRSPESVR